MANTHLIAQLQLKLQSRTDEDLLAVWVENDQEQWSPEFFEAVRLVLTERGVAVPAQGVHGSAARRSCIVHQLEYEVPEQLTRRQRIWKGVQTEVIIWLLLGVAVLLLDLIGSGKLQEQLAPVISPSLPTPASPATQP